jgi:predicted transcriptional regulator
MSIPVDAIGSQNLSYISQERKILNQVKLSGVEANGTVLVPGGFSSSQDTLQAINNTILRLMQTIGMVNENVSALKSPSLNADL